MIDARMIDAYNHLDHSVSDPAADLRLRTASAGLRGVLAVETWDGANRSLLERLAANREPGLRTAFCFRPEIQIDYERKLDSASAAALRVRTADLPQAERLFVWMIGAHKYLLVHGECGIGALCRAIGSLKKRCPELLIYVPHLGWPIRNGQADPDWSDAIADLAQVPRICAGVSAFASFSKEPFPHEDLKDLALQFIARFRPESLVIGTDYPLFERSLYGDYLRLGRDWIRFVYPGWRPVDAIFA